MTNEELGYFLFMDSIENRSSEQSCFSWENKPPISRIAEQKIFCPEYTAPPTEDKGSFGQN